VHLDDLDDLRRDTCQVVKPLGKRKQHRCPHLFGLVLGREFLDKQRTNILS
jgi:hypothetical protein